MSKLLKKICYSFLIVLLCMLISSCSNPFLGPAGIQGEKGDKGEQGIQGEKGDNGTRITIGDNGNWFVDGEDSGICSIPKNGTDGLPGKDGLSTYELYRKYHTDYEKSEEEWLNDYLLNVLEINNHIHTYSEEIISPTCTSVGFTIHKCTQCEYEFYSNVVKQNSHEESDWIIDVESTLISPGSKHKYCKKCSTVLTIETIEKGSSMIECWGDSLTTGAGGNKSGGYVTELHEKIIKKNTNFYCANFGVGGENTQAISSRKGAIGIIVKPGTSISADVEKVKVELELENGGEVSNLVLGDSGFNPCSIAGVEGRIDRVLNETNNKYEHFFTRSVAGEEISINRPTTLLTYGSRFKGNIIVCFMGQNGGWNDYDDLIRQYKSFIDFSETSKYIIVGLTSGSDNDRSELEGKMYSSFGRHYINIRKYMVEYGLDDANINPTDIDISDVNNGIVPNSLRSDGVHLNDYGYGILANQVYIRGQELGYWK